MRKIASTDNNTPVYQTYAGAGYYTYKIGEYEFKIFRYTDCEQAPWLTGMWSVSLTNIDPWYSDPVYTKRDCVDCILAYANRINL